MILVHAVGSYCAVLALCIIFCVPKRYLNLSSIVGAIGWVIYTWAGKYTGNEMLSIFLAALVVSVTSHIFARWKKAPVTLFLIPGVLPLVPGIGMYRIVYYMISEKESHLSSYYFVYTLQMAGMIAIAIFITDTFFKAFSHQIRKKKKAENTILSVKETEKRCR
ncbi:MAG: threonine/serine exporter family protein [Lachnospiraceae bacterium]|nr:threonine/serine exporter family protein [Robinsoniella sp.]MDY3765269.1 threonine/serine exporter family protein [Lachnospiraceae bacterium]